MKAIEHGGNIYEVAVQWGVLPESIIDFSANINPLGWPPGLTEYLNSHWDFILHYPDTRYRDLMEALSNYIGVDAKCIIAANGAMDIIYSYMQAVKPRSVLIPSPTFAEYKRAAAITGAHVDVWPMGEDFAINVEALCYALKQGQHDMLVLCNPNNPTGSLLDKDSLISILDRALECRVNVLLDEAFIEFTADYPKHSMAGMVASYPNLCVIRAFTKFFAIPGLRLGYGIMSEQVRSAVEAVRPPWAVNAVAALAGSYVLHDRPFMEATRRFVENQRRFLTERLSSFQWLYVYPTYANFMLLKLQGRSLTADMLQQHFRGYRILIRNASSFDGLDDHYVRLAVKDERSNESLVRALADFETIKGREVI